jgi:hypothetical protein
MDVDVITISIQAVVEYQRQIHETTRVDQAASFANSHFLNVKHEHSVEDLESDSALATE